MRFKGFLIFLVIVLIIAGLIGGFFWNLKTGFEKDMNGEGPGKWELIRWS